MRRRVFTVGAVVVLLVVAATGVVLWRAGDEEPDSRLEAALALAPEGSERFSWTDWAAVRAELRSDVTADSSAEEVAGLMDAGFDADLTSASALVQSTEVLQEEYGVSPASLEWELFAQEWLGRGDIRQAVRALYLATLVHLHRERRIDYNRALTNWIYVRQFRGESEQKGIFTRLTRTFDEVWYGDRPLGEELYRAFEQGVRALGTPAPTGMAGMRTAGRPAGG